MLELMWKLYHMCKYLIINSLSYQSIHLWYIKMYHSRYNWPSQDIIGRLKALTETSYNCAVNIFLFLFIAWSDELVLSAHNRFEDMSVLVALSVLVAVWLSARRAYLCSQKEYSTKFETRWLQKIPFSKELTDNNSCALGLLFWEHNL